MADRNTLQWQTATAAPTGVRVYRLNGVLTDSEESHAFLANARREMSADPRPLLLDLAGVELVTSTGVGIVATLYKLASSENHLVALAGLSRRNELILEVVQLLRFMAVFENEQAALEGYAVDRWVPAR